jgi:2-C-methyl-D-erythritol 4-phosphate cytidylyltransferase
MAHFLSHRHGWDALVCAEEIGGSVLDRSSGGPIDRRRFVLTTSPEMVAVRTLRAAVMSMEDDEVLAVDAIARTGGRVGLVYHDLINMKITRPGDLKLAEQLVRAGIMIGKIHAPVPLADREAVCAGHQ